MPRRLTIAIATVSATLVALILWSAHSVRRSHSTLLERFATESMGRLDDAANAIREDLSNIQRDLSFTARLVQTAPALDRTDRELQALLTIVKQYRRADVFDADGRRVSTQFDVAAGRSFRGVSVERLIDGSAERTRALRNVQISASAEVLDTNGAWYRAFAAPLHDPENRYAGCLVLLVDMKAIFERLQLVASPSEKVLVLRQEGRPTPESDPALARAISSLDAGTLRAPQFADLVTALRHGDRGIVHFGDSEATQLGLPPSDAIAAYRTVETPGGRWALAIIGSTSAVRSHERAILLRVIVAAVLAALALVAMAQFILASARRTNTLRERLRHAGQIEQMNQQSQHILDNIPVGIITLGRDHRVRALNRSLRERLRPAAPIETLEGAFPQLAPQTFKRVHTLIDEAQASGGVRTMARARLTLFEAEGEYRLQAVPLGGSDPTVATVLVIEDLTEIESLANQLLRAEKLATVGVLGAGIAHEIGTPLGVIRARAEFILGKLGREHAQASGLETIVRQSDHVTRVIKQLLDFSRTKVTTVRPVEMGQAAQAVVDLVRFHAEKQRLEVAVEIAESTPLLAADPDQLQQVLVNLVINALDASSVGGRVTIRACRHAETPADAVRVEVVDAGCGIPEAHRHQVFDPFFTTKRRGQGTGLGLTVASQIVRSHGGQIQLDSIPERGTRVTLVWPAAITEENHHDVAAAR